jgi:phosphoribosylanthranilate isomerase
MSPHLSGNRASLERVNGFFMGNLSKAWFTLLSMNPRVKICGITSEEDAAIAVEAGADAIGFILYEKSKRFLPADEAWEIAEELPPLVSRVAVTVNQSADALRRIADQFPFDFWQLHGDESLAQCEELADDGFRLIKALGFPLSESQLEQDWNQWPVEAYLLDKASAQRGGTGETFDWKLAVSFQEMCGRPCFLSGGLNPKNVAQAIKTVQPFAVDVCSGVEEAPGRKNPKKVQEFISICLMD